MCAKPLPEKQRADALFCSRECYRPSRRQPDEQRACAMCGTTFSTRQSSRRKYCSVSCMWWASEIRCNYGLTPEQYHAMVATGVCAACGGPAAPEPDGRGGFRRMSIDHCHATGKVRGLVHARCNAGLASARDNTETLFNWAVHLHRAEFDLRDLCLTN